MDQSIEAQAKTKAPEQSAIAADSEALKMPPALSNADEPTAQLAAKRTVDVSSPTVANSAMAHDRSQHRGEATSTEAQPPESAQDASKKDEQPVFDSMIAPASAGSGDQDERGLKRMPPVHPDTTAGESASSIECIFIGAEEDATAVAAGNLAAAVPSQSSHRSRPESFVASPLTHPNGVDMFPTLSATEQQEMSWEALTQAEESIIADIDAPPPFGDNVSDGGYESEGFSSGSTSAESSVRDYLYENGRRYHRFREGAYNFPNDDVEQEREDMKHAMVKLLCSQKLHFAPIGDNPQQILDIGTGTGIWVIEMGDQFPSASVLGIDLSPIQPDWLPPNVRFIIDDAESPWLYPRDHFDYIHSRNTVMALKNWMRLFRRALEHLKPGGWIELQEIHHCPRSADTNVDLSEDHEVAKFWSYVSAGLAELGVDLNISSGGQLTKMLQEAGYVNVTERVLHIPIGTWPKNKILKTVGLYWRTILLDGLQAIALGPMVRGLKWTPEEIEVFLTGVRKAYYDNQSHMYMPLHIMYAQKPEETTT